MIHELFTHEELWTMGIAVLTGVACAIPGVFLLLRRMSMMGDAISHAILPGLAGGFIAVLVLQSAHWLHAALPESLATSLNSLSPLHPAVMLTGAALIGALTAAFTQWVHQFGRVEESAAMGVVFTLLFAIGLVMIEYASTMGGHLHGGMKVDLDPKCVLYGMMDVAALRTTSLFGIGVPWAAVSLGIVAVINGLLAMIFFKELRISAFDPGLAETVGIPARIMHYGLMMTTAVTTVAAFEAVGSILVIAMLVVPAAAARLLSHRLAHVVWLAIGISILIALTGYVLAEPIPRLVFAQWLGWETVTGTETPGMMATMAGIIFILVVIFSPSQGMLTQLIRRRHQRQQSQRYNDGPPLEEIARAQH